MKYLKKEYPIDFVYTIELTRKELIEIRNKIERYYVVMNIDPYGGEKDCSIEEIDDILNN